MILPDAAAVGARAADLLDDAATSGSRALGLATGSSPASIYAELIRRHAGRDNPYRSTHLFLLDEYIGLPAGHPERYVEVIRRSFTDPLGIELSRVHAPDVDAPDPSRAAASYERSIADAGGIELQLVGVGRNGHIAFNEPGAPFDSRTRAVQLSDRTRRDNARFFGGDLESVPRMAMSQGIQTILEARRVVLVATGGSKAAVVADLLRTPPTTLLPATALHQHPAVTMLVDLDAASGVEAEGVLDTVRLSASFAEGG